ncbi:MAG: hypoxanthine phosphoribosyltransferase [Bdellovibrionales bacterium]|nr:hypoxanthine phosphoribosyltransferase [Bdellovibrionales bacterium]
MELKMNPLISEAEISKRVKEMAKEITEDLKDQRLMVVGVLKGSFMFYSDLIRELDLELICDFCSVSSYQGAKSSGEVRLTMDLSHSVHGQNVLIIEDIVDTGLTMQFLQNHIASRNPKSLRTAGLLLKPDAMKVDCKVDYVGFQIANDFVVGYGLDYENKYRNLPFIAQVQSFN